MDSLLGVRCLLECARRSLGHSFTVYLFSLKVASANDHKTVEKELRKFLKVWTSVLSDSLQATQQLFYL